MRLLELRLKNLNSLKGDWLIDFTDPAFLNEGIFAITGDTGAGKTTILDAICLALYSQTPRLGEITGSFNEMMTQGTGECAAEVLIEIDAMHYRCSWSQHRARKKADGKLAAIKHEVSDAKTGKILEDKKSKTTPFIQNLIGMDFSQFTRSIMLAQGSFAAFLQSNTGDRAAILEKITGTAIYAQISKEVFEKKREQEGILQSLKDVNKGLTILNADDEAALIAELADHQRRQNQQRLELNTIEEQLGWLAAVMELQQQHTHYQNAVQMAARDNDAFIPDATALAAANKALELESPYQALSHSRTRAQQLKTEQQQTQEAIPEHKSSHQRHLADLNHAQNAEKICADTLHSSLPMIKKAREYDNDIHQLSRFLIDEKKRKATTDNHIQQLIQSITKQKTAEQQIQAELTAIATYLAENQALTEIDAHISTLNSNGSRLKALLEHNITLHSDQTTYQESAHQQQQQLATLDEQQQSHQRQIDEQQRHLECEQQQQNDLLAEQTPNELRDHIVQLNATIYHGEQAQGQAKDLAKMTANIDIKNQALPTLKQDLLSLEGDIQTTKSAMTALKSQRQDKQDYLLALQQVAKLEDYIHELEDGTPCPLCGATEHPYGQQHPLLTPMAKNSVDTGLKAEVNKLAEPTLMVQTQKLITKLDEESEQLASQLSEQHIRHATEKQSLMTHQQQLAQSYQDAYRLCMALNDGISQNLPQLSSKIKLETDALSQYFNTAIEDNDDRINPKIAVNISHLITHINSETQALTAQKEHQTSLLSRYDALSSSIAVTQQTIAEQKSNQQQQNDARHSLITQSQLTAQTLTTIDQQLQANFIELSGVMDTIMTVLNQYPTDQNQIQGLIDRIQQKTTLNAESNAEFLEQCRHYRNVLVGLKQEFDNQKERQNHLINEQNKITTQLEHQQSQLNDEQSAYAQSTQLITDKTADHDQFCREREALFSDKNPDEEAQRLQHDLDTAKNATHSAQRHHDNSRQALTQLHSRAEQLADEWTDLSVTLSHQEESFATLLTQSQFDSPSDFEQARLPKARRDELQQRKSSIEHALSHAQSRLQETNHALKTKLDDPKLPELTRDNQQDTFADLTQRQQQLRGDCDTRLGIIGAIEQQLRNNDAQKNEHRAQSLAIDAQEQALKVWQELYVLIGSADGKKYRTFAQGLTFNVMISHANAQLQKMSNRYLLTHDKDNALELNVIDNYQGGETRSTKNLSGGEGFIISLALALGLSQMASQNIRVDSLFLDEGFGTLDEESLDIALDTLTNLQQEGKIIGVISHVQALKARIVTQIHIHKIAGGFSEISGQGCQKGYPDKGIKHDKSLA